MNPHLSYAYNLSIFLSNEKMFPIQFAGINACLSDEVDNGFLVFLFCGTNDNGQSTPTCKNKSSLILTEDCVALVNLVY
jgi:hypothetical protein